MAALGSGGLVVGAQSLAHGAPLRGAKNANDTLRVAIIGVRGRGMDHVKGFAGNFNCQVVTICDVDQAVIGNAMKHVEEKQGKTPKYEQDLRRVMEDKSIDVVSIATPNHWHALAAIWALQAGKHVYVEKPVSHNVSEGRRIVEAARKYNRICQTGTQSRSNPGLRDSIDFIQSGKLGPIKLARGVCYKLRPSIGKVDGDQPIPKSINYDLWCGPAPVTPLHRQRLHYDWHWIWNYGNGDLGNQGIHEMDKARWGLGKNEMPKSVVSYGGRFGYEDDGETANTQVCLFDYGDCELVFEVRGLPSRNPYPFDTVRERRAKTPAPAKNAKQDNAVAAAAKKAAPAAFVGNIFYGTEGVLVCPSYDSGVAFDLNGNVIKQFKGGASHYGNFLEAVRAGNHKLLNADIEQGHLSSALCHLGNISYRLGTPQRFMAHSKAFGDDGEAYETLARMKDHLKDNTVAVDGMTYKLGRKLKLEGEQFVGDSEANSMLTREYRKGFEVPTNV